MASQLFLYNAGTTLLGCGLDGIGGLLATTGSSFVKVNTATGACTGVAAISGDNRGITSIATTSTASYVFVGSNKIYEYLDNNGTFSNTINVATGDTIMALTGKLVNGEYRCYYYPSNNTGVLKYLVYGTSTICTVSSSGTSLVLSGLTEMGGYFYGCGANDHTIYKIDYTTGIATVVLVADSSITWRYITNDGTNLYACAQGVGAYIINPTTLAMSLISVGASAHSWHGIAYLNAKLYMTALDGYIIGISNPASGTYMTEPTASLASGSYSYNKTTTLSADSGASIYYTTDGSTPTKSSTLYSSAINITGVSTLKIIAYSGYSNTSVVTYTYKIEHVTTTVINVSNLYNLYNLYDSLFIKYGSSSLVNLSTITGSTPDNYKYSSPGISNCIYINGYVYVGSEYNIDVYHIVSGSWVKQTSITCNIQPHAFMTDGINLYCLDAGEDICIINLSTGVSTVLVEVQHTNIGAAYYYNGYFYLAQSVGSYYVYRTSLNGTTIGIYAGKGGITSFAQYGAFLYASDGVNLYKIDLVSNTLTTFLSNFNATNIVIVNGILYGMNGTTLYSFDIGAITNYAALGGVWKKISNMYVSQAGVWKTVSKLYKAESGSYVEKI